MSGVVFSTLESPPSNIGTITPPAIIASTLFRSANSGNVAFVAQPSGTSGFQLQQTDSTVTGGNARGAYAVDLQMSRQLATQVASGVGAVAIGVENTSSNSYSFAAGLANAASGAFSFATGLLNITSGSSSSAFGELNTASGTYSLAAGLLNIASGSGSCAFNNQCLASGDNSIAMGVFATTRTIQSLLALGTNRFSAQGKSQLNILSVAVETSTNTPARLTSSTTVSSTDNQLVLQNNSAIAFSGLAIATITGGGDTASWKVEGGIKRGANAASTVLVGIPTVVSIGADVGAAAWTLALTADTTNGCLAATVTNGAGVNVRVVLSLFASEVAF